MSQPPPPPRSEEHVFPQRQKLFIILSLVPVFAILLSRQAPDTPRDAIPNRRQADDIISLTLSLARIPSPSGHEQAVFQHAEQWLSSRGLTVHKQRVPPLTPSHRPRENLLAVHGAIGDIRVLLCTHLDTVPGGPAADVVNGTVVGRGVVDAKGQAAGFMLSLVGLADARVGLLLVSGEETDHAGMVAASGMGIPEVTLVNGEPTEGMVAGRQKGMLKGVVRVVGKRAHSGYPHLGESAVDKLLEVVRRLRAVWPARAGGETMNVGLIRGGSAANVVAGEAEARVLWRVADRAEAVREKVLAVVGEFEGVGFEVVTMNDAVELYVPERAGREFGVTEVAYNTDVPYYRGAYERAVVFGGGSITVAHTDDEAVSVSALREFGERVNTLVGELL